PEWAIVPVVDANGLTVNSTVSVGGVKNANVASKPRVLITQTLANPTALALTGYAKASSGGPTDKGILVTTGFNSDASQNRQLWIGPTDWYDSEDRPFVRVGFNGTYAFMDGVTGNGAAGQPLYFTAARMGFGFAPWVTDIPPGVTCAFIAGNVADHT